MKQKDHLAENAPPELSIVIPAFNEAPNLAELHRELMLVLPGLDLPWELIIIDDGSTDNTWQVIEALHAGDRRVKGVRLSRNFGHQHALLAGLTRARGQAVITMDADLQQPPAVIPQLLAHWQQGSMVVQTRRQDSQQTSWFKNSSSRIFYRLFSFLSGVTLESGTADFRLLDRRVVDGLLEFREAGLFLRGLIQWTGFQTSVVDYVCQARFRGQSKYTIKNMLVLSLAGLTSFSIVPLRIGIFIGILTSLVAFAALVYAFFIKLFTDRAVQGWASAVSIVSFLFGILFILIGLLGEYIGRILIEVKHRPRFLVSQEIGLDGAGQKPG